MFDSPFAFCSVCGEMVLLDQTRRECSAEHHWDRQVCSGEEVVCPLARCFTGHDFAGSDSPELLHQEKQHKKEALAA